VTAFYAPDFSVRISGLTMAADVRQAVRSLTCETSLDSAAAFTLEVDNAGLRFTDSPLFDVGKEVEVHMGYAGALEPIVLGEITAISPSFPESGAPTLTVTGYDKSHRMRHNSPPSRTFKHQNDSLIVAQIAAENLLLPVVDPAPLPRRSVTQTSSDWALLRELAERNSFQLYVEWDRLHFHLPRPPTRQVVLEWGANLSSFSPRLSTSGQVGAEVVRGYDDELAQTIVAVLPMIDLGSDLDAVVERLGSAAVEQLARLGRHVVRGHKVDTFLDAAALGKALLKKVQDGLFEGSGSCIGLPTLKAGDSVDIRGVGRRFSGRYTVSQVRHTIDEGGYRTTFETTQRWAGSLLTSLREKITATPPPDRQPPVQGVWVGRVVQNVDPQGLGRVQVVFPHLGDDVLSAWARVVAPAAGGEGTGSPGWGGYFLPDRGDEVLVAFEQGDVDRPVVVGALWTRKVPPPHRNTGTNPQRGFSTRTGMRVLFDETPGTERLVVRGKAGGALTLSSTAEGEQVLLTDRAGNGVEVTTGQDRQDVVVRTGSATGRIRLEHATGSSIELHDGGVRITAQGDLALTATGGDIILDAANVNVTVAGVMDVS
jgi:phage protein D